MAHLLKVLTLVLALCASPAFAGYAQLKPPPGWSQGLGAAVPGQAGVFNFGKAANASSWKGTTVLTNAALNVAGKMVVVPASMRVAANGAVAAAQWSFGNPWLFVAALAAPIAYQWFKDSGLVVKNGVWNKTEINPSCENGVCYEYYFPGQSQTFPTAQSACSTLNGGIYSGSTATATGGGGYSCIGVSQYAPEFRSNLGDVSRRVAPARHPTFTPIGDREFLETMAPKPMPNGVPKELPDVNWPIEVPTINPKLKPGVDPSPAPSPLNQPQPQPLRVPVGEPQPVPNSDPQKWQQPAVDVVPANTPQMPWQVDLQPKKIDSDTPDGIKQPVPVPVPQPDPVTGETPKTTPSPMKRSVCVMSTPTFWPVKSSAKSKPKTSKTRLFPWL